MSVSGLWRVSCSRCGKPTVSAARPNDPLAQCSACLARRYKPKERGA